MAHTGPTTGWFPYTTCLQGNTCLQRNPAHRCWYFDFEQILEGGCRSNVEDIAVVVISGLGVVMGFVAAVILVVVVPLELAGIEVVVEGEVVVVRATVVVVVVVVDVVGVVVLVKAVVIVVVSVTGTAGTEHSNAGPGVSSHGSHCDHH